jgi:hypothetical protein
MPGDRAEAVGAVAASDPTMSWISGPGVSVSSGAVTWTDGAPSALSRSVTRQPCGWTKETHSAGASHEPACALVERISSEAWTWRRRTPSSVPHPPEPYRDGERAARATDRPERAELKV